MTDGMDEGAGKGETGSCGRGGSKAMNFDPNAEVDVEGAGVLAAGAGAGADVDAVGPADTTRGSLDLSFLTRFARGGCKAGSRPLVM
jgi:hypothetical protein